MKTNNTVELAISKRKN